MIFLLYYKLELFFFFLLFLETQYLLKGEVSKVLRVLVLYELYDSKRAVGRLLGAELCDSVS